LTPEQIVQRAERARQLLEDPFVSGALDTIEKEIIEQWSACPVRDVEGREILWRLYMTARKFRGIFEGAIESGKIEANKLRPNAFQRVLNQVR
jgi:hypothetical protein